MTHDCPHCKSGILSRGEVTVLELISRGASYDLIGLDLGLSPNTIKSRMQAIFTKLDARNSPHAVSKAIGLGLIDAVNEPITHAAPQKRARK